MSMLALMNKSELKVLKPLLDQFEAGEMPKKLNDKQRKVLNDFYAPSAWKTFKVCRREGGIDHIDSTIASLQDAAKKAKAYVKTNKWFGTWLHFSDRHLTISGSLAQPDNKLIKHLHKDWSQPTPIEDLEAEVEQLKAELSKAQGEKSVNKGKSK